MAVKFSQGVKPVCIYGLYEPDTDRLRYIGKANNPSARLKSHLRDAKRRTTPVYKWISSLAKRDLVPVMRVLSTVVGDEWTAEEVRLIRESKERGEGLLNLAKGGNQPYCPPEVRAANGRNSAKKRDKRLWRLKRDLGQSLKDGCVSDITRAKLRGLAARHPDKFGEWAAV